MTPLRLSLRDIPAVAMLSALLGCSEVGPVGPASRASSPEANARSSYSLTSGLLPRGIKVSVGEPLFGTPTPPDRAHGEVVWLHDARNDHIVTPPSSLPRLNRRLAHNAPTAGDGGEQGLLFAANSPTLPTLYGVEYNADVGLSRNMPVPANDSSYSYLFAPTLLPPGGSCIEGTVITARYTSPSATAHYFGYENWCAAKAPWVSWITMDATFQSNYVRTMNSKAVMTYVIETVSGPQSPRCWYLDVYNYNLGGWEQFYQSCGTSVGSTTTGWLIWETYWVIDASYCPAIQSASAIDIRFLDANYTPSAQAITASQYSTDAWVGITGGPCFGTGTYTFNYPWSSSPTNSWTAATPNP